MAKSVTNLKINPEKMKNSKYRIIKAAGKGITLGSAAGGWINAVFPDLSAVGTFLLGRNQDVGFLEGLAVSFGLASKPGDMITPGVVMLTTTAIGILGSIGVSLVKGQIEKKKEQQNSKTK